MDLVQKRNTNVPGTIAGFYYQILMASKALCATNVKSVGVETGADVVITWNSNRKTYIETKLHTKNFHRCSTDITKTIYNFYCSYHKEEIEYMHFISNVDMKSSDKSLFDNWTICISDTVEYIKKAILKESIQHDKKCKEKYEDYKKMKATKDENLFKELLQDVEKNNTYEEYAIINSECSYEEFANVLKFEFRNRNKCTEVIDIKSQLLSELKKVYSSLKSNINGKKLDDVAANGVLNEIIVKFYDLTVSNSHNNTENAFTSQEFQDCLESHLHDGYSFDKAAFKLSEYLHSLSLAEMRVMEELDLSMEEDKRYFECYCQCEKLFVDKLRESNGNVDFMGDYFVYDPNGYTMGDVQEAVNRLIKMLAVIIYYEEIDVKDIELCENMMKNINIASKLQCCYKYMAGKDNITQIVRKMARDWEFFANVEEGQVIVAEANYRQGGAPCEINNMNPEIYNFTQVDENRKDFEFLKKLNYKCTNCINYDEYSNCNFWKGGGGLCRKI